MKTESLEIAIDLRRSVARLTRRLRLESRATGLSVAKHSILGRLYRDGPQTPGSIAAAEGVQPQSITRVLAELERSGWALRSRDSADRRQFKLEITPQGRDLVQRDAQTRALWLATTMDSCLTPVERQVLQLAAQLMDKLSND